MSTTARDLLVLLLLLAAVTAADARPRIGDGRGTILLIGGGLEPDSHEIHAAIRTRLDRDRHTFVTQGKPIRIGIVPSSKATLREGIETFTVDKPGDPSYERWFRRLGFEPVLVPIACDVVAADPRLPYRDDLVALVRSCQAVFLQGGDQARDAACLLTADGRETPLLSAIRELYAAGGVVAGTSAGAHFLCSPMDGFGTSYETLVANGVETFPLARVLAGDEVETRAPGNSVNLPGFALLPRHVLTDTHFDARGRLGRMIVAMRDLGKVIGIGIDENTALCVEGEWGEVIGARGVFVAVAGPARFPRDRGGFKAEGVSLSYLTRGDRVNLRTGAVVSSKPALPPGAGPTPPPFPDLFSAEYDRDENRRHPYRATAMLRALAATASPCVVGETSEPSPRFRMQMSKVDGTEFRGDGKTGGAFSALRVRLDLGPEETMR